MATARMTNDLRDTIRVAAMSKAFAKEKMQNEEALKKLSRKVYDKLFSEEIQEAVAKLPKGFIERHSCPNVRISSSAEKASSVVSLKFDTSVAWPVEYRYGGLPLIVDAELYAEYRKLDDAVNAVKDGEQKLRESLNQVLCAATTVAKLIEMWPEGEKFIPNWAKNTVKGRCCRLSVLIASTVCSHRH